MKLLKEKCFNLCQTLGQIFVLFIEITFLVNGINLSFLLLKRLFLKRIINILLSLLRLWMSVIPRYISSYFFLSVHYLDENGKEIKDEKDDSQRSKSSPDIVSCPSTTYDTSQEEVPNVKKNPTVSWEPL